MKKGMCKVSVAYPAGEGKTFDRDYYMNKHMKLVGDRLGDALKGSMVEYGVSGAAPGSDAPFMAVATMYFDDMPSFGEAFGPNAPDFMADIPNFTNAEPVIQISEIAQVKVG